jgi:hypothetical protein
MLEKAGRVWNWLQDTSASRVSRCLLVNARPDPLSGTFPILPRGAIQAALYTPLVSKA